MSDKELDALRPALAAIPREEVTEPRLPMTVFLQEAHDLHVLASEQPVRQRLLDVGLDEEQLDALPDAVAAGRQAQSLWTVSRDTSKSTAQKKVEEESYALRSRLLRACRWNLRKDRVAMGTVRAIADGEGLADLVQDLHDLGQLIEARAAAFAKDKTFDAQASAKQARDASGNLEAGVSAEQLAADQAEAKELRDRAFTHLYELVDTVREAGRYAHDRDDPVRKGFASDYYRRSSRSTVSEQPGPAPDAV